MTSGALSCRGLTKRYGTTLAVDALDLDVPAGSLFGLVGPNGAGKTTTLSMATGLLDVLDLGEAGRTLVVDYSAGMKKKVGLACALVHGPRVLVLDEPFEAVDPVSGTTIRALLTRFAAGGGTVVVSSHVMALVEQLCDHVGVIVAGRVVAAGTVAEVRGDGSLEDRFVALSGGSRDLGGGLAWLASSSD